MTPELWVLIVVAIIGQSAQFWHNRNVQKKEKQAREIAVQTAYRRMQRDVTDNADYYKRELSDVREELRNEREDCDKRIAYLDGKVQTLTDLLIERGQQE